MVDVHKEDIHHRELYLYMYMMHLGSFSPFLSPSFSPSLCTKSSFHFSLLFCFFLSLLPHTSCSLMRMFSSHFLVTVVVHGFYQKESLLCGRCLLSESLLSLITSPRSEQLVPAPFVQQQPLHPTTWQLCAGFQETLTPPDTRLHTHFRAPTHLSHCPCSLFFLTQQTFCGQELCFSSCVSGSF